MEKVFVKDIKNIQSVKSTFLVKDKNLSVDKKGNSYITLTLSDKTGSLDARIFDQATEVFETFEIDDFVYVKGSIQKYQNRNQLIIHGIEAVSPSNIQIADFLPTTQNNIEDMFQNLMGLVQEIKNSFVRDLILNTLNDPEIQPLFKSAPAAKTVHHAYIGGLLEHTLSICNVMRLISQNYKELDLDLLIFGAIFHDIGKIWELSFDTHIGYTDVGRLVGHIPLGSELVERKTKEIPNFPVELKNICKHLVLSHHGLLEYGSPKRPKFLEALVVGMIDELDSRINSVMNLMSSQITDNENSKWTNYSNMYDRYFYLDVLKKNIKKP